MPSPHLLTRLLNVTELPFAQACPQINTATAPGTPIVVTASAGSGKTTLLPALLADTHPGRIIVTQPRRVAARAGARRIAALLGEKVGPTVAYSVRGDSTVRDTTRIEFVTPGLLLRRLQEDPELPGVGAILFDEFHERHIDTDLALAFAIDVRSSLRDNLTLAVTSATVDVDAVAGLFEDAGLSCQHFSVDSPIFPLETRYVELPQGVEALYVNPGGGLSVSDSFVEHCVRVAIDALSTAQDTVSCLLFLPGVSEISRACEYASRMPQCADIEVLPLHGGLSPAQQDAVFHPPSRRRLVVSSALAESSVTLPGVRLVVDSGLARESRVDNGTGIGGLTTVWASRASATQRAGRAAREGAGVVVRVGTAGQWVQRPQFSLPQILISDVAPALLQASVWGSPAFAGLALIDVPSPGVLDGGAERLRTIGAIDTDGRATPLGREIAFFPVAPHIARAAVLGRGRLGAARAADIVALLSEPLRPPGADLLQTAAQLRRERGAERWRSARANIRLTAQRIEALLSRARASDARQENTPALSGSVVSDDDALAYVAAAAFPMWVARQRSSGSRSYVTVQGVGVELPDDSPLFGCQWLAVTELSRQPGQSSALIRSAIPLSEDVARDAAEFAFVRSEHAEVTDGRIRVLARESLGAIVLSQRPGGAVDADVARELVTDLVRRSGLSVLSWSEQAVVLRARLAALHEALGAPWPDVSDSALCEDVTGWLSADFSALASGAPLSDVDMFASLQNLLPWPEAARLDELAPERIPVPVGGSRSVDWSSGRPVVALRVQEAFGWTQTPTWAGGRELFVIHLLDPAGRPVAVTSDLHSFWGEPYQQVRAQLRGRYTKHSWPEDPLSVEPTSRAKPRRT